MRDFYLARCSVLSRKATQGGSPTSVGTSVLTGRGQRGVGFKLSFKTIVGVLKSNTWLQIKEDDDALVKTKLVDSQGESRLASFSPVVVQAQGVAGESPFSGTLERQE